MAARLAVRDSQLDDILKLSTIPVAALQATVECIESLSSPPLVAEKLLQIVTESLAGTEVDANVLTRQMLSICGFVRQSGLSLDEVLDGIERAVGGDDETTATLDGWRALRPSLKRLIAADAVVLTAKAIDLSYDYANLYRRARILTDIRPLFLRSEENVRAAVVSYTLRLRFDNVGGDHDLSLAMDEKDVKDLIEECERAVRKARSARELVASKLELPVVVTGERNDSND